MAKQFLQRLQIPSVSEDFPGEGMAKGLGSGLEFQGGVFTQGFHNPLHLTRRDPITPVLPVPLTADHQRIGGREGQPMLAVEFQNDGNSLTSFAVQGDFSGWLSVSSRNYRPPPDPASGVDILYVQVNEFLDFQTGTKQERQHLPITFLSISPGAFHQSFCLFLAQRVNYFAHNNSNLAFLLVLLFQWLNPTVAEYSDSVSHVSIIFSKIL